MWIKSGQVIDRLQNSVMASAVPVIIAGDFNSHSLELGSPDENRRGTLLADAMSSLNLYVCNRGNQPTFVRGLSRTHIDVTFAAESIIGDVNGWKVVDDESYSLHKYIWFELSVRRPNVNAHNEMRWSIFKLDTSKLQEALAQNLRPRSDGGSNASVEAKTKELICWLAHISDFCMPRNKGNPKRKPVPWWSENIATIRAEFLRRRRNYLRRRRRVSEEECQNEALSYKEAKKQLVLVIKNAKSRCWVELCNEVEHDPWGRPYRTVTKILGQRRPIVGIELPERLEHIISKLFPTDVNGDTTKVQWLFDPNDFP